MLDYIFTRLYHYYEKKEKGGYFVFSSSIVISVIRLLLLYSVIMMLHVFSGGVLSVSRLSCNQTGGKVVFILAFIVLINFDYSRYKRIHPKLLDKYKKNPCNKWFRMWMVAALLACLLISPLLWRFLYSCF